MIKTYIDDFPFDQRKMPWEITQNLPSILENEMKKLGEDYIIK